jgi:hypothetical protein
VWKIRNFTICSYRKLTIQIWVWKVGASIPKTDLSQQPEHWLRRFLTHSHIKFGTPFHYFNIQPVRLGVPDVGLDKIAWLVGWFKFNLYTETAETGIVHWVQRLATGWTANYIPRRGKGFFSTPQRPQTGSEARPASYRMGTGGSFPRVNAVGPWSWPVTSI